MRALRTALRRNSKSFRRKSEFFSASLKLSTVTQTPCRNSSRFTVAEIFMPQVEEIHRNPRLYAAS